MDTLSRRRQVTSRRIGIGVALSIALAASPWAQTREPEARSISGKPFHRVESTGPAAVQQAHQLRIALERVDMRDAASIERVGRIHALTSRYREAVAWYDKAIALDATRAAAFRHRGEALIVRREFALARADLERAAALTSRAADVPERSVVANPAGPGVTLQFEIWRHLGVVRYLQGDFAGAADALRTSYRRATTDDARVVAADWLWLASMRAGRQAEAAAVLQSITPGMQVFDERHTLRRLLAYKGAEPMAALLDPREHFALVWHGYGVGTWHLLRGDTAFARRIYEQVTATPGWAARGFIAAEVELARMPRAR